jgi:hypothetical protein
LQTNFGEYFENEEKRKRVRKRFQEAVLIKVLKKKDLETSKRAIRINRSTSNIFSKSPDSEGRYNGQGSVSPPKLTSM